MTIEIYKDKKGDWRWRLLAKNKRVLADSAEGYKRKASMFKILNKIELGNWDYIDKETGELIDTF